ncbi:hypothetical protein BC834DRAFT_840650 [Gloeopeniophorella convolvens]|nr:hypothetical protein BC834DRAFT_840650 [Gloeopeniophorella convolvens]
MKPLGRDLDPSGNYTKLGPIRTPHWVAVSHVCHYWREVALSCKALWTDIPLVSIRWANRALELSHPHPITLHLDSEEKYLDKGYASIEALQAALAHMDRIRLIRMHSPWGTRDGEHIINVVLYHQAFHGAPVLEELDLAPVHPPQWNSLAGPATTLPIVPMSLRTLRLDQCNPPADCFLFHQGLTHLRLSGTTLKWKTVADMLVTLARMPKLQVLELYDVLPLDRPSSELATIQLPALQELYLSGTAESIWDLLRALNLPKDARLHVTHPWVPPTRTIDDIIGKHGEQPVMVIMARPF